MPMRRDVSVNGNTQVCVFCPPRLPLSAALCRQAVGRYEGVLRFYAETVFDMINGTLDRCVDLISELPFLCSADYSRTKAEIFPDRCRPYSRIWIPYTVRHSDKYGDISHLHICRSSFSDIRTSRSSGHSAGGTCSLLVS